jgi:uncharacterized cupin superfamily protein
MRYTDRSTDLPEVGIWECSPGGWPLEEIPYTEFVYMLNGSSRITDIDGLSSEIRAGDTLILPFGWSGRWDVLEITRKL